MSSSPTDTVISPTPALPAGTPPATEPAANPPGAPTTPAAAPGAPAGPAPRVPLFSAEAWSPLKVDLFRSLYIATSIAQIGTWIREAGGPWLMTELTGGQADMVARVLVFSNLPICLFSVFAGALADVLDRRRLLIFTQTWMMVVSALLGIMTIAGHMTPGTLLGLTFLVGTGTALAGPALQALLPELVPRKDLALAINLNSVALNVARALGPAMFILVIIIIGRKVGVGASFLVTAASFVWPIWVLFAWKRAPQVASVHGEELWGAIRAGFQYTVHSPANRAILLRVFLFIVPAVVMWAQIPIIATTHLGLAKTHNIEQDLETEAKASAMLFAFVGIGAVFGVLLMPGLQKRFRIDPVVNVCTGCFAAGLILLAFIHHLWLACIVMVFLGINWVIIPTNFNTATQKSVPLWVKGRAISFYLTVLFGSFAVGGAIWGRVTKHFTTVSHEGISNSLLIGGVAMGAFLVLAKWFPLTINEGLDLTAAFSGPPPRPVFPDLFPPPDPISAPIAGSPAPTPVLSYESKNPIGPVEVSLQYDVPPTRVEEFLKVMPELARQRRRNGAAAWALAPASAPANGSVTYHEIIRYRSASELKRQPARMTKNDLALVDRARALHSGQGEQPGKCRILTGEEADPYAAHKKWVGERVSEIFDCLFDQTAATFDRYAAARDRAKARRVVTYREVTIRIPE